MLYIYSLRCSWLINAMQFPVAICIQSLQIKGYRESHENKVSKGLILIFFVIFDFH